MKKIERKSLFLGLILKLVYKTRDSFPSILDVGCGNGDNVKILQELGYNCFGCDVEFKDGKNLNSLLALKFVKKIKTNSGSRNSVESNNKLYQWPFEKEKFDYVISRAVLEHVFNLDEFANENSRVLREGGIAIHYFPSSYAIIEPHCGVPFAGLINNKSYIKFCCFVGLCFKRYRKRGNVAYLDLKRITYYRSDRSIKNLFSRFGLKYQGSGTKILLELGLPNSLKLLSRSKIIIFLFELFRSKVMIFEKLELRSDV